MGVEDVEKERIWELQRHINWMNSLHLPTGKLISSSEYGSAVGVFPSIMQTVFSAFELCCRDLQDGQALSELVSVLLADYSDHPVYPDACTAGTRVSALLSCRG